MVEVVEDMVVEDKVVEGMVVEDILGQQQVDHMVELVVR